MKMQLMSVAASAVLAVTATQGVAATLVIDTFDDFQRVSDLPAPGLVSSSTYSSPVGDLGASRTLTVENTKFVGDQTEATYLVSAGGYLSFANGSGAAGVGTIDYTFDAKNFLGYGANPYFSFDVADFDHDTWIGVYATDAFGTTVSYDETLFTGFSSKLALTQFEAVEGAPLFDWSNVTALKFVVSSTTPGGDVVYDIDGRIASITLETVPLPASGLLLMGGVAGLAALRRRNKKSA